MANTIGIKLALKDQFTSPLKKATENTKTMDREVKKLKNRINYLGNSIKSTMKSMAKWSAIGIAGASAGMIAFSKSSVDAAKAQLKVEKTLAENMKRTSNATSEKIEMIKKEASALQNVGVVGDEVALAGASQLAVYGLKADAIKKLMPNLNDMIAKEKGVNGTQEDAIAMADALGKALQGQTKGLLKYGVALDENEAKLFKNMSKQEKINYLNKKLTKSIGGYNKALAETDEGKITQMTNNWGDMKEELGKKLLPHLGNLASWFNTKIPTIQDLILSLADKIQELIIKASPYIQELKNIISSIFEKVKPIAEAFFDLIVDGTKTGIDIAKKLKDNWDRLSPAIYSLVGGLTAYKTVMFISNNLLLLHIARVKVLKMWTVIQELWTGKLTIKQLILNTVMKANPIGLVITAITLLVGAIWMLWKNWDIVIKTIKKVWKMLDNNPLGKLFKNLLRVVFPIILVIENFDFLKAKFFEVVDSIKNIFLKGWELLKSSLETILNPIETVKNAFSSIIDKLKFWNNTEAKDKDINLNETKTVKENAEKVVEEQTKIKKPRHALGTSYFQGGITGINEGGRDETAILPAGTKILSHEQSKKDKSVNLTLNLTVQGNLIGNRDFMDKCGQHVLNKVLLAISNT